jgi:hypothetical protein
MPCSDITETLRLVCDENDCLVDYQLSKRTCGAAVGQPALLLPWIGTQPIMHILKLTPEDLAQNVAMAEEEEFLYFKHFFAVQEALKAFTGAVSEPLSQVLCTVLSVYPEGNHMVFEGDIPVGEVTQRIKACGHCGSCGVKKTASSAPQQIAVLATP